MRSLARRLLTCEFFGVELFPLANYQATIRASQLRISLRSGRVVYPRSFHKLICLVKDPARAYHQHWHFRRRDRHRAKRRFDLCRMTGGLFSRIQWVSQWPRTDHQTRLPRGGSHTCSTGPSKSGLRQMQLMDCAETVIRQSVGNRLGRRVETH